MQAFGIFIFFLLDFGIQTVLLTTVSTRACSVFKSACPIQTTPVLLSLEKLCFDKVQAVGLWIYWKFYKNNKFILKWPEHFWDSHIQLTLPKIKSFAALFPKIFYIPKMTCHQKDFWNLVSHICSPECYFRQSQKRSWQIQGLSRASGSKSHAMTSNSCSS